METLTTANRPDIGKYMAEMLSQQQPFSEILILPPYERPDENENGQSTSNLL